MSKWLNKSKFKSFQKQKNEEREQQSQQQNDSRFRKWNNPKMGSLEKPKEYILRFLPDPTDEFYKKYFYHMFRTGEKWNFIGCPKTHDMDSYCPWCAITQILYQGTDADKKKARDYSRKERYVGNVFIKKDPRDADTKDEWKCEGTTRLYEFPATVEKKINTEVTDEENGWGIDIFDPVDGYNFLLRIGAKKPDQNGKVWPDYDGAMFARKPSAISTDESTLDSVMESRQNLDDYLQSQIWATADTVKLLKTEMIWDDVKDDYEKLVLGQVPSKPEPDAYGGTPPSSTVDEDDVPFDNTTTDDSSSDSGDDDEDLLAELRDM